MVHWWDVSHQLTLCLARSYRSSYSTCSVDHADMLQSVKLEPSWVPFWEVSSRVSFLGDGVSIGNGAFIFILDPDD